MAGREDYQGPSGITGVRRLVDDLFDEMPAHLRDLSADDVSHISFRCSKCSERLRATVLPGSPHIAKHRCSRCGNVNEIQTRESAMDKIEEHVEEQKDEARFERRSSVSVGGEAFSVTDRRRNY